MSREGVRKEQRSFTDEEVGKILSAAPEPFGTILAVTAVLGLRIGEGLALRVSDVDFARKLVRVRQSVDAATCSVQAVKSHADSADVLMPTQLKQDWLPPTPRTRRAQHAAPAAASEIR
jgi:integrase